MKFLCVIATGLALMSKVWGSDYLFPVHSPLEETRTPSISLLAQFLDGDISDHPLICPPRFSGFEQTWLSECPRIGSQLIAMQARVCSITGSEIACFVSQNIVPQLRPNAPLSTDDFTFMFSTIHQKCGVKFLCDLQEVMTDLHKMQVSGIDPRSHLLVWDDKVNKHPFWRVPLSDNQEWLVPPVSSSYYTGIWEFVTNLLLRPAEVTASEASLHSVFAEKVLKKTKDYFILASQALESSEDEN